MASIWGQGLQVQSGDDNITCSEHELRENKPLTQSLAHDNWSAMLSYYDYFYYNIMYVNKSLCIQGSCKD